MAAVFGLQVEQLTLMHSPLCAACSPETLRSYFVACMPKLSHFNGQEVTAKERQLADAMFGPLLLKMQQSTKSQQEPLRSAVSFATGGHHQQQGKGLKNSLLRALQQQQHQAHAQTAFRPAAEPAELLPVMVAATPAAVPFLAPAQQCVGSASLEALRQSLSGSCSSAAVHVPPATGSCSGLSQRALLRRRHFAQFSAAFDDAVSKIILETVLEMKNVS